MFPDSRPHDMEAGGSRRHDQRFQNACIDGADELFSKRRQTHPEYAEKSDTDENKGKVVRYRVVRILICYQLRYKIINSESCQNFHKLKNKMKVVTFFNLRFFDKISFENFRNTSFH